MHDLCLFFTRALHMVQESGLQLSFNNISIILDIKYYLTGDSQFKIQDSKFKIQREKYENAVSKKITNFRKSKYIHDHNSPTIKLLFSIKIGPLLCGIFPQKYPNHGML